MTNKDIFKTWAPVNARWVDWVRPVPFVAIPHPIKAGKLPAITLPALDNWTHDSATAIIVDFPGTQSVAAGMWLAQNYGYRPIPIYNGTIEQRGARATSDNSSILHALAWGASILLNVQLSENAPPAFLTDTNRLQRHKLDVSVFDNSWDVYHQDLPTEEYFLNHGIKNILIVGNSYHKDLKRIFNSFPKKKLSVYLTDGYETPKCVKKGR